MARDLTALTMLSFVNPLQLARACARAGFVARVTSPLCARGHRRRQIDQSLPCLVPLRFALLLSEQLFL